MNRAIDDYAAASAARDEKRAEQAFRAMGKALSKADDATLAAVGPRLGGLIEETPPGASGTLAVFVGACVDSGADPLASSGPILAGLRENLRLSLSFVARWQATGGGELPDPDRSGPDAGAIERAGGWDSLEAIYATHSWWELRMWEMASVAMLSHGSVRRRLEDRAGLLALARQVAEHTADDLKCLVYSLLVLDDEPLVVLHRPSGKGFRLRMSGIGDNFQLHTLLSSMLIGNGHLPGEAPSAEAVAACLDTPADEGRPHTIGAFNLVAATGEWIWNEGTPSDIPVVDGVRLLVLEDPPYVRSWSAGRFFPNMRAELVLEGPLNEEDTAAYFARAAPTITPFS